MTKYLQDLLFSSIYPFLFADDGCGGFLKPLTAEEEYQYFIRLKSGDKDALNVLINHNMRLVVHISKRYAQNSDADELMSIGSCGLLKAINTFDPDKGNKFSTYSAKCISNEILMYLRSNKKNASNISLFTPIGSDKDGNEITISETLCDDTYNIGRHVEFEESCNELYKAINQSLDSKEKYVIIYRYGLCGKEKTPQRTIAENMKVSRSYVSRIEKKALLKLRAFLEKSGYQ